MNSRKMVWVWTLLAGTVGDLFAQEVPPLPFVQRCCPRCSVSILAAVASAEDNGSRSGEELRGHVVTIPKKASLFSIAECLVQAGVIQSKWAFVLRVFFSGTWRRLKAGSYRFLPGATADDIIRVLVRGATILHKLTVPEGLTVEAIATLVRRHPCLNGDIKRIPGEGRLLPGTYHVQEGESRQSALERMEEAQQKLLNEIAPSFPLGEEALLVLASIVEKETRLPSERGRIAGVFLLRLQKGMPLQADPTVIYGLTLGQKELGRMPTRADWKVESPYNTYLHKGLPPTPICCPGEATLRATASAVPTGDLFFVADGRGGHRFSATLSGHNQNIQAARKK